ncbi:recombinase family protein [Pseudomonas aeruginosa]|uniref:recombinase family protein n=1 Tax=Pseudomonas aeruginosa TaxID=287 RepID=UPI0022AE0F85|nr:recombinase family protein [Pseudomonas aeruginosa]MDV7779930.1 recombinase family protein [Pseudomonas aeruginosa]HCT8042084.1 recombinase family protein [Pseudomonas aeruginosa]
MARFILYARRALDTDPATEDQFAPLRAWALAAGHEVVAEYADENIDTRAARDPRPYLDRAIFDTLRGAADGIAAVSLDRLARSVGDLEKLLREFSVAGAGLYVADLDLDTRTPAGRALIDATAAVVAFDKACRVEALRRGHRKARAKGVKIGAPRIARSLEDKVAALLKAGVKPHRIRTITHVGASTVTRIRKELEAAEAIAAGEVDA